MILSFRRLFAVLGAVAVVVVSFGLGPLQPAHAATVSVSVTCSSLFPEEPITAAQGDIVEVTIDNACYSGGPPTTAASQTPAGWRTSYFSSWPTLGAVANTVNKFTWVVSATAPVGPMPGSKTALPYVCNNCGRGVYLRFTITAASTTTVAPTTTAAPTTTVPTTTATTVPPTTTTESRLEAAAGALPETGTGSSPLTWALVYTCVGILLLGSSRLRGRVRKR